MQQFITGPPPYVFALGAIVCFGLTILLAFRDKLKPATLLGGLFFLCAILAYFPQLDSIAAFNINVKLRQNLDRAEEILGKLREEREARVTTETAMLAQLKWRGDVTPDKMRAFVAALNERKHDVEGLTIFTLIADPEANDFGNRILYAMKEAGVHFRWGRIPTVMDVTEVSVSITGLTLYQSPQGKTCEALFAAFSIIGTDAGGASMMCANTDKKEIPVPALFVMLKQPAFSYFPKYFGAPDLPTPPWMPK